MTFLTTHNRRELRVCPFRRKSQRKSRFSASGTWAVKLKHAGASRRGCRRQNLRMDLDTTTNDSPTKFTTKWGISKYCKSLFLGCNSCIEKLLNATVTDVTPIYISVLPTSDTCSSPQWVKSAICCECFGDLVVDRGVNMTSGQKFEQKPKQISS